MRVFEMNLSVYLMHLFILIRMLKQFVGGEIFFAVSIGLIINSWSYKRLTAPWDGETVPLMIEMKGLMLWSPLLLWPIWTIVKMIIAIIAGDDLIWLSEYDQDHMILNTFLAITIVVMASLVGVLFNHVNYLFPGIMIGWGVYKFMMNDNHLSPFHYFYDANFVIADSVLAYPLPSLLHIPIQLIVALSLIAHFAGMLTNN